MSARANVVLPAPRSPERATTSPGSSELAMSTASRWVACSSGNTAEKLEVPAVVNTTIAVLAIGQSGDAPVLPEHDPEKACPGLDPGLAALFGQRSCSNKELERHGETSRSHSALGRRALGAMPEGKDADDGGAAADGGFQRYRAAVQLDKRAHQREAETGAAMARAERMSFEPIEYLVLDIGRDARAAVGH